MTPHNFINLDLPEGTPVLLRLRTDNGRTRKVRLFFRGYRFRQGKTIGRTLSELYPLFSPKSRSKSGIGRGYYHALDTGFENIESLEILPDGNL